MRQLSAAFARLAVEDLPFERLEVNEKVAKELFKDNQFKMAQIPKICEDRMLFLFSSLYFYSLLFIFFWLH